MESGFLGALMAATSQVPAARVTGGTSSVQILAAVGRKHSKVWWVKREPRCSVQGLLRKSALAWEAGSSGSRRTS